MKPRVVMFLSTYAVDIPFEGPSVANDDWRPDRPATAAHALQLAVTTDPADARTHANG